MKLTKRNVDMKNALATSFTAILSLNLAFGIPMSFAENTSKEKSYAEVYAEDHGTCTAQLCSAGKQIKVSIAKDDPMYACSTEAKAIYVNTVLGLVSFQQTLSGQLPNISPKTGEPEYQGETKQMLDTLRNAAGVSTLDEAASQCIEGSKIRNKKFMVLNSKHESDYVWAGSNNIKLWIPLTATKLLK